MSTSKRMVQRKSGLVVPDWAQNLPEEEKEPVQPPFPMPRKLNRAERRRMERYLKKEMKKRK